MIRMHIHDMDIYCLEIDWERYVRVFSDELHFNDDDLLFFVTNDVAVEVGFVMDCLITGIGLTRLIVWIAGTVRILFN